MQVAVQEHSITGVARISRRDNLITQPHLNELHLFIYLRGAELLLRVALQEVAESFYHAIRDRVICRARIASKLRLLDTIIFKSLHLSARQLAREIERGLRDACAQECRRQRLCQYVRRDAAAVIKDTPAGSRDRRAGRRRRRRGRR